MKISHLLQDYLITWNQRWVVKFEKMPSIKWSLISFHFIKAVIHLFSHALHYRTSIKTLGKLMTVKYNPSFISCNKALKCYILITYCLIYWRISFKGKCVYTHMRTHMPLYLTNIHLFPDLLQQNNLFHYRVKPV